MTKLKHQPKTNPEIERLAAQVAEVDAKWKRALADYQNLEKRNTDQRSLYIKLANAALLERLVGIIDDLRRAAGHLRDEGVSMILRQCENLLKDEGVAQVDALGKPFDPTTMECIESVPGIKDTVTKVHQTGYTLEGVMLRPARVDVGNGNIN